MLLWIRYILQQSTGVNLERQQTPPFGGASSLKPVNLYTSMISFSLAANTLSTSATYLSVDF